jgi:hypothetical protein
VTDAATNSVRERIVGEIASLVLKEADRIGDSTLSAEDLAKLFDSAPIESDERFIDPILFGLTPMAMSG